MFNQEPDPDNGYTMIVRQTLEGELTTTSLGTTSACAENNPHRQTLSGFRRNYLRVRGEYCSKPLRFAPLPELPPHARRIQEGAGHHHPNIRTTSACAENTMETAFFRR